MLRSEIIESANKFIQLARIGALDEAIRSGDFRARLNAYHILAQAYSNPSNADQRLLEIFGLRTLVDPDWWSKAFLRSDGEGRESPSPSRARAEMVGKLNFAVRYLPKITQMLESQADKTIAPESRIKLVLPESEDQLSSPARIVAAIDGISLMYAAVCRMHNEQENTLALRSCDSGSDKSFDFTGLPQVIEQVKSVIFGIVDRVIFFREAKFSERVKLVAQSLPVLDQISQLAEAKKISPEQAELLRRDLINGATKFLETGSRIPETSNSLRYDPASLLQPSPKLLLEGPRTPPEKVQLQGQTSTSEEMRFPAVSEASSFETPSMSSETDDLADEGDGLSNDERRQLAKLLKKRRSGGNDDLN